MPRAFLIQKKGQRLRRKEKSVNIENTKLSPQDQDNNQNRDPSPPMYPGIPIHPSSDNRLPMDPAAYLPIKDALPMFLGYHPFSPYLPHPMLYPGLYLSSVQNSAAAISNNNNGHIMDQKLISQSQYSTAGITGLTNVRSKDLSPKLNPQMSPAQSSPGSVSSTGTELETNNAEEGTRPDVAPADDSGYRTSSLYSPLSSSLSGRSSPGDDLHRLSDQEQEAVEDSEDEIDPVGDDSSSDDMTTFDCHGRSPSISSRESVDTKSSHVKRGYSIDDIIDLRKSKPNNKTVKSSLNDSQDDNNENSMSSPIVIKPLQDEKSPQGQDPNKWKKGHIENILRSNTPDKKNEQTPQQDLRISDPVFWMNNLPNLTQAIYPDLNIPKYSSVESVPQRYHPYSPSGRPMQAPYTSPSSATYSQAVPRPSSQVAPSTYSSSSPHSTSYPLQATQMNGYSHLHNRQSPEQDMEGPGYLCKDCDKSYSTFSGLTKHKQYHCASHVKKEFSCKHCAKTYTSLGALKMHIRTHTLPCKCQLCGKAFSRPWLLQGHIRTHTGEKPFSCAHCQRSFADRSNLRAHLQTHSDIKKYSCKKCSKTFSRMSLLLKHEDGGCNAV